MKRARFLVVAILVLSLLLSGCQKAARQESNEASQSASMLTTAGQPVSAAGRTFSLEQLKSNMDSLFRIQFEGDAVEGSSMENTVSKQQRQMEKPGTSNWKAIIRLFPVMITGSLTGFIQT